MAAKKSKDKKKGPRGKKARAKAKLEQVWGEQYNEDERLASKVRIGKSRLNNVDDSGEGGINGGDTTKGGKKQMEVIDPLAKKRRGIRPSTFDRFLQRKQKYNHNVDIDKQRRQFYEQQQGDDGEESSDDESSSSDDDEMNGGGVGGGSFATLLKRISGPSKKHKSSRDRMDVDSDDDDYSNSSSDDDSDSEDDEIEESDAELDQQSDDDNEGTNTDIVAATAEDPYEQHFSRPPLPQLNSLTTSESTSQQQKQKQQQLLVPHTGNNRKVTTSSILKSSSMDVQISGPLLDTFDNIVTSRNNNSNTNTNNSKSTKKKQSSASQATTAPAAAVATKKSWNEFALGPYKHVREVIARNWSTVNKNKSGKKNNNKGDDDKVIFTSLQTVLYPAISRYADVLITSENRQNRNEINNLLSMHILNHVLTTRTRVQRHNRRIKELTTNNDIDSANNKDEEDDTDKWRDQGYTRPKVLILLPTRGTAWTFVQHIISLLGNSAIVDNEDRFNEEYGPLLDDEGRDEEDEEEDVKKERRRKAVLKQKGQEWNDLFSDTINSDDDFKIGISVTPNVVKSSGGKKKTKLVAKKNEGSGQSGTSVKLFADFYHCDIILASPIGLKMATTANKDGNNNNDNASDNEEEAGQTDIDFLSSIDVCLIGRSDVLLMQNWDHVNTILDSTLNKQPKKITDIDFGRVRNYFLEGQSAHWRQFIVVSSFTDPYMLSTFRRHAKNVEGAMKVRRKVSTDDASICDVMVRVKQVFQRVSCTSLGDASSNRLRYFSEHVLPKLTRLEQKHTLIYIPSYFDFVAVRNLLLKREADFVSVTEYARVSEVSRGRARFLQGRKSIMLYTGRAHFFLRHKIKGARHVIFFGLPEYAEFYPDVVNMLSNNVEEDDGDGDLTRMPMSCLSLFTKFDAHQLERVVGTAHTDRMVKGEKSSYMFCA